MEAFYFFAGITLLVVANLYIVHRINKRSYLHIPITFRRADRFSEQPLRVAMSTEELTRSQKKVHDYVDWYTQRTPATRNKAESGKPERTEQPGRQPDQEVFVGVAVMDEAANSAEAPQESNIDRWFRTAVNA